MTQDMWHVTRDTLHMTGGGGEPFVKSSAPQLLRFGSEGVLKIFKYHLINHLISNKGVCRTALATPGLLIISMQTEMACVVAV